jgi:hypothetical protein
MTAVREDKGSSAAYSGIFYLLNPASGSNTVSVSWVSNNRTISVQAASFLGTLTTASVINASNGTTVAATTSLSYSVTSTVTNCWFIEVGMVANGVDMTQGAEAGRQDWVPDWEYEPGGAEAAIGGTYYDDEPIGSETFSWSWVGNEEGAGTGVAIAPAVAGRIPRPPAAYNNLAIY